MKDQDKSNKKMIETLWLEINRAIIKSGEVKSTLLNLRDLNLLKDVKEYNLVLDVNKLIELLSVEAGEGNSSLSDNAESARENYLKEVIEESRDFLRAKGEEVNQKFPSPANDIPQDIQRIDGRSLTPNQILFEEYAQRQFDEKAWMSKVGIRL